MPAAARRDRGLWTTIRTAKVTKMMLTNSKEAVAISRINSFGQLKLKLHLSSERQHMNIRAGSNVGFFRSLLLYTRPT